MNDRIFISYRREDSSGFAGRLYDRLANHFGRERIFMDVDTIQPGLDFVSAIESAVSKSEVQIVIIGSDWLNATDAAGNRRLDNPEDFIRIEIAAALKQNARVIPVLVERTTMPLFSDLPDDLKPLTRRHAIEISHTRFSSDVQRLIQTLELALEQIEAGRKAEVQPSGTGKAGTKKIPPKKTATEPSSKKKDEAKHIEEEKNEKELPDTKSTEGQRITVVSERPLWVPVLVSATGWSIAEIIKNIAYRALYEIAVHSDVRAISWTIYGIVGAWIIGKNIQPLVQGFERRQLFIITASWALGGIIYLIFISILDRYLASMIGWFFFIAYGSFVTGVVLRRLISAFQWKQVFIITISWTLGAAISIFISETGFFRYYMSSIIRGIITGGIGGGVMFWLIYRTKNRLRRQVVFTSFKAGDFCKQ